MLRDVERQLLKIDDSNPGADARLPPVVGIKLGVARESNHNLSLVALDSTREHATETPRVVIQPRLRRNER